MPSCPIATILREKKNADYKQFGFIAGTLELYYILSLTSSTVDIFLKINILSFMVFFSNTCVNHFNSRLTVVKEMTMLNFFQT